MYHEHNQNKMVKARPRCRETIKCIEISVGSKPIDVLFLRRPNIGMSKIDVQDTISTGRIG
ncbi:MAG: hypothetical protein CL916_10400 [Deltaproteobacteria bacterium]|nr:hypothetical protein [Deltaproteobacteria bacterium]